VYQKRERGDCTEGKWEAVREGKVREQVREGRDIAVWRGKVTL
jgi:hypothetical protein